MTYNGRKDSAPLAELRYHVSGAVARGESEPIVAQTRTVWRAPTGCYCYRVWNICDACRRWNERVGAR